MPDRPLGTGEHAYPPVRTRSAWWRWRHARPFWGGLLVTLSGAEILVTVKAPLPVIVHVGMQGLAGYLVPIVILLCGILLLTNPTQRLFYSIVAAVMALASWVTSNLGGFMFGLLLGLVGSALAFAWSPSKAAKHIPAHAVAAPTGPEPAEPEKAELPPAGLGLAGIGLAGADAAGPEAVTPEGDGPEHSGSAAREPETSELGSDSPGASAPGAGEAAGADEQAGSATRRL